MGRPGRWRCRGGLTKSVTPWLDHGVQRSVFLYQRKVDPAIKSRDDEILYLSDRFTHMLYIRTIICLGTYATMLLA